MQGFFPSLFVLFVVCAGEAKALTYRFGGVAGVMTQPTSNYFHLVRGGFAETGSASEKILVRGGYTERPPFAAAGFIDQEFFSYLMIGTKLTKAKTHGLYAFVGGGQLHGVLKGEEDLTAINVETRRYELAGLVTSLEYAFRWKKFEVALAHQSLIGKGTKPQTEAYVAWPYTFLYLNLGISL